MEILEIIRMELCLLIICAIIIMLFLSIYRHDLGRGLRVGVITIICVLVSIISVFYIKFVNHPEEFGYMKIIEETTANE